MIVTEQKPLEEVLEGLSGHDRVFIVGCAKCATACRTGGEVEVKQVIPLLEDKGHQVVGWTVIEAVCDRKASARELDQMRADILLSMTCGAGTQVLAELLQIPVMPALNTLFLGSRQTPDCFIERCTECGRCVLGETAGVCPVTRCSKGLLNGPCGGTVEGKCEVDPEQDCGWDLIYRRLRDSGNLESMRKIRPPVDREKTRKPQRRCLPC